MLRTKYTAAQVGNTTNRNICFFLCMLQNHPTAATVSYLRAPCRQTDEVHWRNDRTCHQLQFTAANRIFVYLIRYGVVLFEYSLREAVALFLFVCVLIYCATHHLTLDTRVRPTRKKTLIYTAYLSVACATRGKSLVNFAENWLWRLGK